MKFSIVLFFSFFLFCVLGHSQITFSLLQPPCKNDGILKIDIQGVNFPATVYWSYNGKYFNKLINMPFDQITDYGGGYVTVYVTGGVGTGIFADFNSDLPFKVSVNSAINICPTPSTAQAIVTGGQAPYSFEWNKNINGVTTYYGNSNPINVSNGEYFIKVTDNVGCEVSNYGKQDSTSLYVYAPVSFTYDAVTTLASCTNGTAAIENIVGGSAPFTFQWSNGATTQALTNLTSGNYQATVTDGAGCSAVEYEIYVEQSIAIEVPVTVTPASCELNDGAAIAFGSGGTAPYTFIWSNGQTSQSINNLSDGSYIVEAKDANGCVGTGYVSVNSISPVYASISNVQPSSCTSPTGSAELLIAGGTAPYLVEWNTFPQQTGPGVSNVGPGTYSFSITDATGCKRTGSVSIPQESIMTPQLSVIPALCGASNGSAVLNINGGALPIQYLWTNGNTSNSLSNLSPGNYGVTATDALGCTVVKYTNVNEYSDINIGFVSIPASCIFSSDGSVISNVTGGTPPYTYSWSNGSSNADLTGAKAGNYVLYITDSKSCNNNKYVQLPFNPIGDDCYCTIEGNVYHDLNNNCTQDAGEPGIPNIQIKCTNFGFTYTDMTGYYSIKVPTGTYQISETVKNQYPLASCQNNQLIVNVTAQSGCTSTVNFANSLNPIHDMHINLWTDVPAVPGFGHSQNLIITNSGTVEEIASIASYLTDGQLGTASFTPSLFNLTSADFYTADPMPALMPGQSAMVQVDFLVPTNTPLGTEVYFKDSCTHIAPMANWLTDYSPWDNVNQRYETVVGSYDPNFIQVSPQGLTEKGIIGIKDSILEYMIHFQNYGTYFAQNVVVVCQLDSKLDWKTLQPVFSSDPSTVRLTENGLLTYTFKNIQLYPKTWSEELSKGFFTFKINTNKALVPNDEIKNYADIYFDFNEPIRTNTAISTIENILNVAPDPNQLTVAKLYPNPTKRDFAVDINAVENGMVQMNIVDLYGRTVQTEEFNLLAGNQSLDVQTKELSNGMYMICFTDKQGKSQSFKLIIMNE